MDLANLDLRIGTPERLAAQDALEAHLIAQRIDSAEYEQRVQSCQQARSQAELLRIFADLPAPHPELPAVPGPSTRVDEADDDVPPLAAAILLALLLGLPVAVILGFVYGAWWTLAVPVAVSVVLAFTADVLSRVRRDDR